MSRKPAAFHISDCVAFWALTVFGILALSGCSSVGNSFQDVYVMQSGSSEKGNVIDQHMFDGFRQAKAAGYTKFYIDSAGGSWPISLLLAKELQAIPNATIYSGAYCASGCLMVWLSAPNQRALPSTLFVLHRVEIDREMAKKFSADDVAKVEAQIPKDRALEAIILALNGIPQTNIEEMLRTGHSILKYPPQSVFAKVAGSPKPTFVYRPPVCPDTFHCN